MATAKRKRKDRKVHRKGQRASSETCAVCAVPGESSDLLRIVVSDEHGVAVDPRHRIPGTALYLHPAAECVNRFATLELDSLSGVSPAALRDAIEHFLDASILAELSRVAAAGQLIGGHDKLAGVLREGRIHCVVVARDAAHGTLESLRRAAGPALPFHPVDLDKDALGARVGQAPRAAVGFASTRASAVLEKWLAQRWQLGAAPAAT